MAAEDTIVSGVAGRYASALFDLAREQNSLPQVETDLDQFARMMTESADLKRLVTSPVFAAEDQVRALRAVLEAAGIRGIAGNFLGLVAQNRRLFAAPDMVKAFKALAAQGRGETVAEVTSAEPLSERHQQALRDALREQMGRDVSLETRVDPSLIGGLVVKVGSRMIDTSLKTRLNSLKIAMKRAG